jgi:hypothetical protein
MNDYGQEKRETMGQLDSIPEVDNIRGGSPIPLEPKTVRVS